MLTLIENGELYAPEPRGRQPVLLFGDKIWRIGECDARAAMPPKPEEQAEEKTGEREKVEVGVR